MAIIVLGARATPAGALTFVVHLDDDRKLPGGQPDPEWVATYPFPAHSPEHTGQTMAQYQEACFEEVGRMAAADLAARTGEDDTIPLDFTGRTIAIG